MSFFIRNVVLWCKKTHISTQNSKETKELFWMLPSTGLAYVGDIVNEFYGCKPCHGCKKFHGC